MAKAKSPAGYSGTPIAKKLGITDESQLLPINAPKNYPEILSPLPDGVRFASQPGTTIDIAHLFVAWRNDLEKHLTQLRKKLRPDAVVWVSWPKKTAKLPTDITEQTIRDVALPMGWVDIKVCAVDETWSGLKLVVRKELR
jgi:hypothetical protein